jgi:hypothetical protein
MKFPPNPSNDLQNNENLIHRFIEVRYTNKALPSGDQRRNRSGFEASSAFPENRCNRFYP